jgi:hypothetical protein
MLLACGHGFGLSAYTDSVKIKMESLMQKFQVTKLKLSCLSGLQRKQEREKFLKQARFNGQDNEILSDLILAQKDHGEVT